MALARQHSLNAKPCGLSGTSISVTGPLKLTVLSVMARGPKLDTVIAGWLCQVYTLSWTCHVR